MFGFGRQRSHLSVEQHIASLKGMYHMVEQRGHNPTVFALGVRCNTNLIALMAITLPERFPDCAPYIRVYHRVHAIQHNWLNSDNVVVGCPYIQNWSRGSDLGAAVHSIMKRFSESPPIDAGPHYHQHNGGHHTRGYSGATETSTAYSHTGHSRSSDFPLSQSSRRSQAGHPHATSLSFAGTNPYTSKPTTNSPPPYYAAMQENKSTSQVTASRGQSWTPDSPTPHRHISNASKDTTDSIWDQSSPGRGDNIPQTKTELPAIPEQFPELNNKLFAELQVFEFDEQLRKSFLYKQESLSMFHSVSKALLEDNLELAQQHVEQESEIMSLRKQIRQSDAEVQGETTRLRALLAQVEQLQQKFAPPALSARLAEVANALDVTTEDKASEFARTHVEGEEESMQSKRVVEFLENFIQERRNYHSVAAKAEIIRQRGYTHETVSSPETHTRSGINASGDHDGSSSMFSRDDDLRTDSKTTVV